MTGATTLRATSEAGDTVDDPSEDALLMMFEDLEAGEGAFVIVDDLRDRSGHTYAQAARRDDGSYDVEYRDGGPDRHYGTEVPDHRAAHALLTGWAFGLDGWRGSTTWRRLSF